MCIFEETGVSGAGCERIMASRAATPEPGRELELCVQKALAYYTIMGFGSFATGNSQGGLTTQEEKSMGAYLEVRLRPDQRHSGRWRSGNPTGGSISS